MEITNCKFCKSDNTGVVETGHDHAFVKCHNCCAQGPNCDQVGGWWKPIQAWNRVMNGVGRIELGKYTIGDSYTGREGYHQLFWEDEDLSSRILI